MGVADILSKAVRAKKTGDEQTTGDARAIGEKTKMIQDYNKSNAATSPTAKAASRPSPQDKVNPSGKYGDKPGEKRIDTSSMVKPLGSFHKGGKVKKTGAYNLKKGEAVLTAAQQSNVAKRAPAVLGSDKPAASASPDEMQIQKLDDGSFHITHRSNSVKEPMPSQKKFSAKNAKHLVRHVRQTFGAQAEPDGDE